MGDSNATPEKNKNSENKPAKSKKTMWIVIAIVVIAIILLVWAFGMNSGGMMPATGGSSYY